MAFNPPPPNTTRETQADEFLRLLDEMLPLQPGSGFQFYVRNAYRLINAMGVDPLITKTAGVRLVKWLPIMGVDNQWAMLVSFCCAPVPPIHPNTLHLSFHYFTTLLNLHRLATRTKPATLRDFAAQSRDLMHAVGGRQGVPQPPLLPEQIQTVRSGWVTLRNKFY